MKVKNQYFKIFEYLHLSFNKRPSIQYKLWLSPVLLNHNNGEHCWLGNGLEDDHWQSWLEGRNWVGKCAQATGMNILSRILSSKADSNIWERFTRSELKLESVHQESPRSDIFRKRATKPLLKQKHRQKHLTVAKEKKNWGLIYKRCVRTKWAYTVICVSNFPRTYPDL